MKFVSALKTLTTRKAIEVQTISLFNLMMSLSDATTKKNLCVCVYMYIKLYIHIYSYVYYIHLERGGKREKDIKQI